MAQILQCTVAGLAGREAVLTHVFNPDVNVIFGFNGSGKTSLLKILHSALLNDASSLFDVPFSEAEVIIGPGPLNPQLVRRVKKSELPQQAQLFPTPTPVRRSRRGIQWTSTPDTYADLSIPHRYLPTARLYLAPDYYYGRFEPGEDAVALERQLDAAFAQILPQLWNRYFTTLLRDVRTIQANGLASIVRGILTTDKWDEAFSPAADFMSIYDRAQRFLSRQGSEYLLGSPDDFRPKYDSDARVRRVVSDLNDIESKIEEAMVPRDNLQSLVAELIGGPKRVVFEDNEIHVRTPGEADIGLATLSSGEKHVLRILVESLLAQENMLIVDEPELSMHVDWQRRLVPALLQLNPGAQLILATHSPEIMADLDDSKLLRLWPV